MIIIPQSFFFRCLIFLDCDQACAFSATGKAYYTGFDNAGTSDEIQQAFFDWLERIYPGIQFVQVERTVPREIGGAIESMAAVQQNQAKWFIVPLFFSFFFAF